MTDLITIERAGPDAKEPLAQMLARAFAHEPLHCWLFPAEDRREQRALKLFRCELGNMARDGVVYSDTERRCAALWCEPGKPQGGSWSQGLILFTLVRVLGRRTRKVLHELDAVSQARPREPHWYLSVIGTDPAVQGRGLASAVMRHSLQICDQDGAGAWLETASPGLSQYYSRFGFTERHRIRLPQGPVIVGMWRPAGGGTMSP